MLIVDGLATSDDIIPCVAQLYDYTQVVCGALINGCPPKKE